MDADCPKEEVKREPTTYITCDGHDLGNFDHMLYKDLLSVDEFKAFVSKLNRCKDLMYQYYCKCKPPVNKCEIEKLLNELECTLRKTAYNPSIYISVDKVRYLPMKDPVAFNILHEVYYGSYENRVSKLDKMKYQIFARMRHEDKSLVIHLLDPYYQRGTTTYYASFCAPVVGLLKIKAPYDKHSLRRF